MEREGQNDCPDRGTRRKSYRIELGSPRICECEKARVHNVGYYVEIFL
jgi:hypothetical protein